MARRSPFSVAAVIVALALVGLWCLRAPSTPAEAPSTPTSALPVAPVTAAPPVAPRPAHPATPPPASPSPTSDADRTRFDHEIRDLWSRGSQTGFRPLDLAMDGYLLYKFCGSPGIGKLAAGLEVARRDPSAGAPILEALDGIQDQWWFGPCVAFSPDDPAPDAGPDMQPGPGGLDGAP